MKNTIENVTGKGENRRDVSSKQRKRILRIFGQKWRQQQQRRPSPNFNVWESFHIVRGLFCFRISSEEPFPWKYLRKFAFASFVFIAIWPHKSCHERKRVAAKLAKTDFSQTLYLLLFEKCSNKFLVLEFITVYNPRFRISFVQFKETLSKNASFTCFCYCFVVVFLLFIH